MKKLPKIALGAWAWGNDGTFGNDFDSESLRPIFETAMENGLNLWDTAFAYGMGTSEKVLAGFIKDLPREKYIISDKFTPQCADASNPQAMRDMIEMQQKLMDTFVESYNFEGKTMIPFCTSGGSGIGRSGKNLESLSKSGTWLEGKRFGGSVSDSELQSWISGLK